MFVGFVLAYGSIVWSGDYKDEARGVEESKDGSCDPSYFEPTNGCAPLDFFSAYQTKIAKLSLEQQSILVDIVYYKDYSHVKRLSGEMQKKLLEWQHLPIPKPNNLHQRLSLLKCMQIDFEKTLK